MSLGSTRLDYHPVAFNALRNPYPAYAQMREEQPVYHNADRELWALTRFEDVQRASRDWETFSSGAGVHLGDGDERFPSGLLNSDPPHHDNLRKVIRSGFTPKAIASSEPAVRDRVVELLDRIAERPHGADLARDFGWSLPVAVVSDILGLPESDVPMLREWLDMLVVVPDTDENARAAGVDAAYSLTEHTAAASSKLREYFNERIAERLKRAADDPLGDIARAEQQGVIGRDERESLCLLLMLAGIHTTASLVSSSLSTLADRPELRRELAADRERIPAAIEELLRYDAPVQSHARITTREAELPGGTVPAGARVVLVYGAANRDSSRWEDPDELDFAREPQRHLAFGEGVHFCIGAPLARLEAKIAFEEFFTRVSEYEICGPVRLFQSDVDRGVASLPANLQFQGS